MTLTETNRRIGRKTAILAKFQTSRGQVIDDLSDVVNLWTSPVELSLAPLKSEEQWMSSTPFNEDFERFNKATKVEGSFRSIVTPATMDVILRSLWGAKSGEFFILQKFIGEFLTLAWVENRNSPSLGTVVRLRDVWLHTVTFDEADGLVRATVQFAARQLPELLTPVPQTLTLPASPMAPDLTTLFNARNYRVFRDPLGVNQEFPADGSLSLEITQRVIHQWEMSDALFNVRKGGKPRVKVGFVTRVSDESWGILTRGQTATKEAWRIEMATVGATLTIDMKSAEFSFQSIGRDAKDMRRISVDGESFGDGSGNDVDIRLDV